MQGDARLGFDRWKTVNGCASEPDRIDEDGSLTCEVWTQCTSGLELQFCTHPGKHSVPDDFLPTALDWAERQVGQSKGTE
jgi:poly(3-hydroxybutyrate) depolymerase